MKTAVLFSGQGAQYEGMGRDLAAAFPAVRDFYARASAVLDMDLLHLTQEELADTLCAQPATVALSLALWEMLPFKEAPADTVLLGGFSLGEYSAFAAAGLLPVPELLKLLRQRARLMKEAADETPGSMYAVLNLPDETVENYLAEHFPQQVWPVNYNCPGQLVIAGEKKACARAAEGLAALGAKRVIPLAVSGAFHTPLMNSAARALETWAAAMPIADPCFPLYANSTAAVLSREQLNAFPAYLAAHMTGPVRWTRTIEAMYAAGARRFIELGPGKTLRGLTAKILRSQKDAEILNIGTAEELQSFLA